MRGTSRFLMMCIGAAALGLLISFVVVFDKVGR